MTPSQRLGTGLTVSVTSCGVAALLATAIEARIIAVALLVLAYATCVRDLTAAVHASVMAWALASAFFLGGERLAHAATRDLQDMRGRTLDLLLLGAWAVVFVIVSLTVPGIANLVVAWVGGVALIWYDDLVRHDPKGDSLRPRWLY
jgi:hypothetical protein